MKNIFTVIGIIVLVLAVAIFIFVGFGNASSTGNIIFNSKGDVQIVKLSVENGNYVLNPSQVKMGAPVRIEGDLANMPGCSKSFVIPSFNVRKTFTSTDNIVEFTPDKAGVFNVMCSMNMYKGALTVLEGDGSKSNYVESSSSSTPSSSGSTGGSCGMKTTGSTGGCGCMG
jgi:plastocyanin domain-containing protein